jgi:ribosomal protein S12 methylthiotransferase
LKDVHWLRLMYAYPSCFTDEMIDAIAESDRVVKYIDMPLQHINDQMLTMMRRVTRKQIETLLDKLRKTVPGISFAPHSSPARPAKPMRSIRSWSLSSKTLAST